MNIHDLHPFAGSVKDRKRLGRGRGTGQGCTSGKGNKGQRSRAGASIPAGFEGGQMPLARRLPKRGFKNHFRIEYAPLNLKRIFAAFPETESITLEDIYSRGLCSNGALVKILGDGEAPRAITIEAHCFSASAVQKLVAAGGKAIALEEQTQTAQDSNTEV